MYLKGETCVPSRFVWAGVLAVWYHSLNVAGIKEMSIRCYGKAIEKMRAKGKTLPEPASQYSLLYSIFPSPAKYSFRSQYPSDSPLIWADWKGVSFWQPQEYSDFRLPPWSPNNHFQLSLLLPAFLFCSLVLMTTQRVRLETHQNSTEKVGHLPPGESTRAVSVCYHHFVLLLSWLWKLAGFK